MNGFNKNISGLPYFCRGKVINGFGRGSKELGIPTANFPESVVDDFPPDLQTGVYFGWGQVERGSVCKMVMSIGWNPYYQNTKKSIETHLLHKFEKDFYDKELGIVVLGYIRPETNFSSLDDLVKAIHSDMDIAQLELDKLTSQSFITNDFFTTICNNTTSGTQSHL